MWSLCMMSHHLSFKVGCFPSVEKPSAVAFPLKAVCSQQVRVMTGSGGRPKPGWLVLCFHPVPSCYHEHMGGDIAVHWRFPNNLSPLPKEDQTGVESKSIRVSFGCPYHRDLLQKSLRHLIRLLFVQCLCRWLFFRSFWHFWHSLKLFSTLSDSWSRRLKWLIRVLELGSWSCKQIFLFSQCHVFSLTLAVRKQRYTEAGLVSSQLSPRIFVMARLQKRHMARYLCSIFHSKS